MDCSGHSWIILSCVLFVVHDGVACGDSIVLGRTVGDFHVGVDVCSNFFLAVEILARRVLLVSVLPQWMTRFRRKLLVLQSILHSGFLGNETRC